MRRLLIALLVALGVVPATASAGLELGLQDDAYLSSADPRAWQLTRELRPDVIRYNVDWSSVAHVRPSQPASPADPAYQWAATDGIVQGAARQGARVLLTIVQAPAWANGNGPPRTAPLEASDFGTFCRAVATRYSGSFVAGRSDRAAAGRDELHGLERAQPGPVPRAPGRARPGGAQGHGAPHARLRRLDRGRLAGRAGRARPAREPRGSGRHRADRVSGALPGRGWPAARRRRAQPLSRQPAAGVPRGREGGPRRDHGAQPRQAGELAAGRLRRHACRSG